MRRSSERRYRSRSRDRRSPPRADRRRRADSRERRRSQDKYTDRGDARHRDDNRRRDVDKKRDGRREEDRRIISQRDRTDRNRNYRPPSDNIRGSDYRRDTQYRGGGEGGVVDAYGRSGYRRSPSPHNGRRQAAPDSYRRKSVSSSSSSDDDDDDDDEDLTEDQLMAKMMGVNSFDTSKGKDHSATDVSGTNKKTKRKYRQYMNRRGGFNRPLSPVF